VRISRLGRKRAYLGKEEDDDDEEEEEEEEKGEVGGVRPTSRWCPKRIHADIYVRPHEHADRRHNEDMKYLLAYNVSACAFWLWTLIETLVHWKGQLRSNAYQRSMVLCRVESMPF